MFIDDVRIGANLFRSEAVVGESIDTAKSAAKYIGEKIPTEIERWGVIPSKYRIKGSVGTRRTLETPWIAVMRKDVTESVQRGFFLIFIYSADMRKVYLGLMLGCKFFEGRGKSKRIRTLAKAMIDDVEVPQGFIKGKLPLD